MAAAAAYVRAALAGGVRIVTSSSSSAVRSIPRTASRSGTASRSSSFARLRREPGSAAGRISSRRRTPGWGRRRSTRRPVSTMSCAGTSAASGPRRSPTRRTGRACRPRRCDRPRNDCGCASFADEDGEGAARPPARAASGRRGPGATEIPAGLGCDAPRPRADERRSFPSGSGRSCSTSRPRIRVPTFLVDGAVAGTWRVETSARKATLALEPFEPLSRAARRGLRDEAEGLVRMIEPGAVSHAVRG